MGVALWFVTIVTKALFRSIIVEFWGIVNRGKMSIRKALLLNDLWGVAMNFFRNLKYLFMSVRSSDSDISPVVGLKNVLQRQGIGQVLDAFQARTPVFQTLLLTLRKKCLSQLPCKSLVRIHF